MTSILNYGDRATCVLFGDGAGAVLLEPTDRDDEGILDFVHEVDGSGGKYLYMPGGGSLHPSSHETVDQKMHYIHQEGAQVFKYAVRRMAELACEMLERNGYTSKELALVVPHQANLRIIRAMQDRLGVDDSKVMVNIERYGNTTAGTIPLGLCDAVEQGRLKKGDLVLLVAVGAGIRRGRFCFAGLTRSRASGRRWPCCVPGADPSGRRRSARRWPSRSWPIRTLLGRSCRAS